MFEGDRSCIGGRRRASARTYWRAIARTYWRSTAKDLWGIGWRPPGRIGARPLALGRIGVRSLRMYLRAPTHLFGCFLDSAQKILQESGEILEVGGESESKSCESRKNCASRRRILRDLGPVLEFCGCWGKSWGRRKIFRFCGAFGIAV